MTVTISTLKDEDKAEHLRCEIENLDIYEGLLKDKCFFYKNNT